MHLLYTYKTSFYCILKQYCYLCIRQELTKDYNTYLKIKNVVTESIFKSDSESVLLMTSFNNTVFHHFINDDISDTIIFNKFFIFLHHHYFLHLTWSRLTLNLTELCFFITEIMILDYIKSDEEIQSSVDKLEVFKK